MLVHLTAKRSKNSNPLPSARKSSTASKATTLFDNILSLHKVLGNQALQRLIKSGVLQTKLTVEKPNDIYEQEADRIAEQVMRMPDLSKPQSNRVSKDDKYPSIHRMCTECEEELQAQTENSELGHSKELHRLTGGIQAQRMCSSCTEELHRQSIEEEEEELLQTKEAPGGTPEVSQDVEAQINSIRGSGHPLAKSVRALFEPQFGYDFSHVRVHTDSQAGESARAVNALAYTVGKDIVFGGDQFAPGTNAGRRLLAHELTHVVQQRRSKNSIQFQQNSPCQSSTLPDCTSLQIRGRRGINGHEIVIRAAELAGSWIDPAKKKKQRGRVFIFDK